MQNRGFFLLALVTATIVGPANGAGKDPTPVMIARWVANLDAARFATREAAAKRLLRTGEKAIQAIVKGTRGGSLEKTSRAIRILSHMAVSGAANQQSSARTALEKLASIDGTIASRKARESLRMIAQTQQHQATKKLTKLGARIGDPSTRQLGPQLVYNPFTVHIGFGWRGESRDLVNLKLIHNAQAVVLEGNFVKDEWIKHVSAMPNVEVLIVKKAGISDKAMVHLARMKKLRQLTVKYCPITDASVASLSRLDRLSLVKLYGTKMTGKGANRLRAVLEFANIDFRRGAFLGVACEDHPRGCRITLVSPGSSADRAGMLLNDIIVNYGGKPVRGFNDLTKLIAQHKVGDKTNVVVLRGGRRIKMQVVLGNWE